MKCKRRWRARGCATSFSSQVGPSSQHHCGRDHHGQHLVQPVSLPRKKEVSSTPGPDSMGEGLGGVLYSARRGQRTTEARENWEEREERKGKKATPEGSKFLTLSHPRG